MKKNATIFIVLALIISSCNKRVEVVVEDPLCTSTLNLFTMRCVNFMLGTWDVPESEWVDKGVFISLSDIHELIRHPDSLAIPEFANREYWYSVLDNAIRTSDFSSEEYRMLMRKMLERRFMVLDTEYRKRFLERVSVSETDSVFLYNYADDALLAFPVNEWNVVAVNRWIPNTTQYDFRIGFHTDRLDLRGLGEFDLWESSHILVYVGKTHPFARGGMREIQWSRIPAEDFPIEKSNIETDNERILYLLEYGSRKSMTPNRFDVTLRSDFNHFTLFMQDIFCTRSMGGSASAIHLLIIDTKTESVVVERVIYSSSSGWHTHGTHIGNLFRNAPPVALGFWWATSRVFLAKSCPFIMFLDAEVDDVYIRCDNQSTAAIIARTRIVDYSEE